MRFGNTALLADASELVEQLRRADCAVDAVDIGGLRTAVARLPSGRSRGQDGLFDLANESGGELFTQGNYLAAQMRAALDRSAVSYLLTFQAKDVPLDGAWRRLRVELVDRRGLRVVARPGWYAPRPTKQRTRSSATCSPRTRLPSLSRRRRSESRCWPLRFAPPTSWPTCR